MNKIRNLAKPIIVFSLLVLLSSCQLKPKYIHKQTFLMDTVVEITVPDISEIDSIIQNLFNEMNRVDNEFDRYNDKLVDFLSNRGFEVTFDSIHFDLVLKAKTKTVLLKTEKKLETDVIGGKGKASKDKKRTYETKRVSSGGMIQHPSYKLLLHKIRVLNHN